MTDREEPPWIGRVIDDRYRVIDLIGRGGMGQVYRVEHMKMGKIAAMKFVHRELASDPEVVARFRQEARAVSKLSHPHTVQVFDFGELEDSLYLVMEYVRGKDLRTVLDADKVMPYSRALPIVIQMALALEEAHEAGIIHRDIKPENVLVSQGRDGQDYIKVLDYGLAIMREGKGDQASITAQGDLVGTPYYMPPEQIRGEALDFRLDIYALGATLYHLITGRTPYEAKSPIGILTKCITDPLVPPSERRPDLNIPAELDAVILKAMAKDRADRYGSVTEFRRAMQACLSTLSMPNVPVLRAGTGSFPGAPFTVASTSPFASENNLKREDLDAYERSFRRRRRLVMLTPLLLLLLGGAAVAYFLLRPPAPSQGMTKEREPNNETNEANPIGKGRTVRGLIGKRLSESRSDVDVYRFEVRAKSPVLLWAKLTGIPIIDTSLQIYDADGRELVTVNNGGVKGTELLPNLVAPPGTYFAVVQEVTAKTPQINLTDHYALTVDWRPLRAADEVEPNDGFEQANRIAPGEAVVGYLGRADDVDVYRVTGSGGGRLTVRIAGPAGVDVALRIVEPGAPEHASRRDAARRWPVGRVTTHGRLGSVAWADGSPGPLLLVARKDGNRAGLEERTSYRLEVRLERGAAAHTPAMRPPEPMASAVPMRPMAAGGHAKPALPRAGVTSPRPARPRFPAPRHVTPPLRRPRAPPRRAATLPPPPPDRPAAVMR